MVAEYNRTMADHLGLVIQPLDWARDGHPAAGPTAAGDQRATGSL